MILTRSPRFLPRLAASLAVVGLWVAPLTADVVLDASASVVLGQQGARAADPSMDTLDTAVAMAWTARNAEGRTAVFAALANARRAGIAPPVIPLRCEGEVSDPIVRFDLDGHAVVVWVETLDLRSRLVTQRIGADHREIIAQSDVLMATPSLAFDADNRPVVAWFEGGANRYAVLAASPDAGLGWITEPLTSHLNAYDILPVVTGGEEPAVYWYSLTDDDETTEIRAARRIPGSTAWLPIDAGLLSVLPANRLPYLYDTQTLLGPGAIWVEPVVGGEFVATADPRRPLELYIQPAPKLGDQSRQLDPDATGSHGTTPAYAWREEGPSGRELIVMTEQKLYRLPRVPHAAQPRLAASTDGSLHLLWVSDQLTGGTGQIHWLAIEQTPHRPRATAASIHDFEPGDPIF